MYYIAIISAIILTSIINILFIKYGGNEIKGLIKITLFVAPITLIQSFLFSYYYSVGSKEIKFGILVLIAMSLTIIFNFLIHFFYFKQGLSYIELTSMAFIFIGVGIYIYSKF